MTKGKIKQKGFTLVELGIVLVIIGIIVGVALKGTEMINNARAKKLQNDLRSIEIAMWTFFVRMGKFPGASQSNGLINYNLTTSMPSYDDQGNGTDPDFPWLELKNQGILPNIPNSQLAKHAFNGYFAIGSYQSGTSYYNAIAIYNIPSFVAQMIDASIDEIINASTWKCGPGGRNLYIFVPSTPLL